jgi:hypothetical protein
MEVNVDWTGVKSFSLSRSIPVQWILFNNVYTIYAVDGALSVVTQIPFVTPTVEGTDQADFETNFKAAGNIPLLTALTTVTTQFELRNKTLKIASASADVSGDGTTTLYMKVPGTPNPTGDTMLDGRWISSGVTFFDVATPGDMVTSVRFVDHDNMLGAGVDFVVGSYTDDDADADNRGWYIPAKRGQIEAEAIGGYGFAPAGYYIMITAKKGGGITTGKFYVNMEWGKVEA